MTAIMIKIKTFNRNLNQTNTTEPISQLWDLNHDIAQILA